MKKIRVKPEIILDAVKKEYQEGEDFLRTKKNQWLQNLKIFLNLEKAPTSVSSSLLPNIFNFLLGFFYQGKHNYAFYSPEEADAKKIANLNKLAEFEYAEMNKEMIDYDSTWDALFYGISFIDLNKWDKENKRVVPEVINPFFFVYDPYFPTQSEWRYYGKWIIKSLSDLISLYKKGILLEDPRKIPAGIDSEIWSKKIQIEKARGGNATTPESSSPNKVFQILEFYTILPETGQRIRVWVDKEFTNLLLIDTSISQDRWNIVIKQLAREPHISAPSSKVDRIEDKHRLLNVLLNLISIKSKDWATPIYEYEYDNVKDKTVLLQRQINQHIPVEKLGSIAPLTKDPPVDGSILAFLQYIEQDAQKASGAYNLFTSTRKKSATESALLQQLAETVLSADAKILSQGEKNFWLNWFKQYKDKLSKNDVLKIQIVSPEGFVKYETLKKDDIIPSKEPSVTVISSIEKEYKELVIRRDLMQILPILSKTVEPRIFRKMLKQVVLPKFIDEKILNAVYPKDIEEIRAEQENELIEAGKLPRISEIDDDITHYFKHLYATNNPQKWAHIFAHELQYAMKKELEERMASQEEQLPESEEETGGELLPTMGGRREVKRKKRKEAEAAIPLLAEMDRELFTRKI